MTNRAYRLVFGASHSEGYEADMVRELITRGHVIEPMALSGVGTLPFPGPVSAPAPAASAPVVTMPPAPWPNAPVKASDNGNGFKCWDAALRVTWLFNDDPRTLDNGQPGARRWKANVGPNKFRAMWVGVEDRPAFLAAAAGQAQPAVAASGFPGRRAKR